MNTMSEVLQANIFFFITGIAVIVFTMLLCIALYHSIKILRSVRKIVERIEAGSEVIAEDMSHLRQHFIEGSLIAKVIGAFLGTRGASTPARKAARKKARNNALKTELTIKDEE